MKFKTAILGVAMLAALAGSANAGSSLIGLTGGLGIPTGDYGDAASNGWHLGATGTHMMNDQWGFGGDLAYHSWNGSEDMNAGAEALFGPGSEFKWSALQASAHAVMAIPTQGNAQPYAKVGFGLYNMGLKLTSPSGDASDSQSEFGFNVGGGMNFRTQGNMSWGVNGAYHIDQAESDLGSNVNFFQVGVNALWGSR